MALFPRERLIDRLRELVGIDVMASPGRFTVVPEGIDVAQIRDAVAARAGLSAVERPDAATPRDVGAGEATAPPARALAYLLDRVAALPPTATAYPSCSLSVG